MLLSGWLFHLYIVWCLKKSSWTSTGILNQSKKFWQFWRKKKSSSTVALLISEYMLTVMLRSVNVSHKPLPWELWQRLFLKLSTGTFLLFLPHWLSLSLRPAGLPQLVKSKHVTALDCNSQDLMYATCGCAPRPVNYIKPIKKDQPSQTCDELK